MVAKEKEAGASFKTDRSRWDNNGLDIPANRPGHVKDPFYFTQDPQNVS